MISKNGESLNLMFGNLGAFGLLGCKREIFAVRVPHCWLGEDHWKAQTMLFKLAGKFAGNHTVRLLVFDSRGPKDNIHPIENGIDFFATRKILMNAMKAVMPQSNVRLMPMEAKLPAGWTPEMLAKVQAAMDRTVKAIVTQIRKQQTTGQNGL